MDCGPASDGCRILGYPLPVTVGEGEAKVNGRQKPRILVVEDELMVGLLMEDMVSDFGGEVVGPVSRFDRAMELAQEAEVDAAVLDIDLAGIPAYPVAKVLRARGIPLIFATGYGESVLSADFKSHLVLTKPFSQRDFDEAVSAALFAGPANE